MEEISIRTATIADLDTLLIFEQGVISAERPFDSTLQNGQIHYYDIKKMIAADEIEIVVAELNSEIIGSGYARIENARHYLKHQQHAYLGFMYVLPQHRGKGVIKKVIDTLAAWAANRNITELCLDVYQDNEAAIKAYEKTGFAKHLVNMRKGIK